MKAISLWQPYASLVASGLKTIETRHWQPPRALIGKPIVIHAAKRWTSEEIAITSAFMQRFPSVRAAFHNTLDLPLGAVLVAVKLVACIPSESLINLSDEERAFGNYAPGRYGWKLEIIKLPEKPIPAKGGQGFWDWNPDTIQE